MVEEGWPIPRITLDFPKKTTDQTANLYDILGHLRNAVAHGRLTFTSDSGQPNEVAITVEDKYHPEDAEPYWRAEIEVSQRARRVERRLDLLVLGR